MNDTPNHVAIIMDGNGRWATEKNLDRIEGHRKGSERVDEVVECCRSMGIPYLTLYAFSEENWNRPNAEVKGLMKLLLEFILKERKKIMSNGIRLNAIGKISKLPPFVLSPLKHLIQDSSENTGMVLTLALSYSAREEVVNAVNRLLDSGVKKKIDYESLQKNFYTSDLPDPDLMIRTSGEMRISNFLCLQMAYSEFSFSKKYWPDFTADDFRSCIEEYKERNRRFGLLSKEKLVR